MFNNNKDFVSDFIKKIYKFNNTNPTIKYFDNNKPFAYVKQKIIIGFSFYLKLNIFISNNQDNNDKIEKIDNPSFANNNALHFLLFANSFFPEKHKYFYDKYVNITYFFASFDDLLFTVVSKLI